MTQHADDQTPRIAAEKLSEVRDLAALALERWQADDPRGALDAAHELRPAVAVAAGALTALLEAPADSPAADGSADRSGAVPDDTSHWLG
ncbi:hypothetical protein OG871_03115 [Kitasatospora sp. NBC_00374]|uniref:hypothetical protein n=1 Tax=Kitasatospora sp. NBC_00374 TaxID=2975964 RepID=UPI0030E0C9EA